MPEFPEPTANVATKAFRLLFLISIGLAALAFVTLAAAMAIKASAILAFSWLAVVVYAFAKFKERASWFLLGTPLIIFWFLAFLVAWACIHNVNACI